MIDDVTSTPRRRIDEIGDESRQRILDASESLFAEQGFDRTSFAEIAKRSGISRGSIPWHFQNKDGLLIAVVERAIDRALVRESSPAPRSLSDIFADYVSWARQSNSALVFMIASEVMTSTGSIRSQYQDFLEQRRKLMQQWVRAHRPEGADEATAEGQERAFAGALSGALLGAHFHALFDTDDDNLAAALRSLGALVDKNIADVWSATTPPELPRP